MGKVDKKDTSWGITLGYVLRVNTPWGIDSLSVESVYVDFGEAKQSKSTVGTGGFDDPVEPRAGGEGIERVGNVASGDPTIAKIGKKSLTVKGGRGSSNSFYPSFYPCGPGTFTVKKTTDAMTS